MLLRISEPCIEQLRKLLASATEVVLPVDLTDFNGLIDPLRGGLQPTGRCAGRAGASALARRFPAIGRQWAASGPKQKIRAHVSQHSGSVPQRGNPYRVFAFHSADSPCPCRLPRSGVLTRSHTVADELQHRQQHVPPTDE